MESSGVARMSTSQIPWSAEAERRLRRRILVLLTLMRVLFVLGTVSATVGWVFHRYPLTFGLVLVVAAAFLVPKVSDAVDQLGQEERILSGVRVPGFGMLANKPRDTSRLTKWTQHLVYPGMTYEDAKDSCFSCDCGEPYKLGDLKWIPNVAEDEEEPGTAAVDPEGGRYVLICPCGIGHYVLKQVSLDASPVDPRQSRRDEKGRR